MFPAHLFGIVVFSALLWNVLRLFAYVMIKSLCSCSLCIAHTVRILVLRFGHYNNTDGLVYLLLFIMKILHH